MSFRVATLQTSDNVTIQYQIGQKCAEGSPAILFCHGLGANHIQFAAQQSFADDYCVVTPTLRGHGNSSSPLPITAESLTLQRFAQDIIELTQHLSIDEFHFVGHGFGGLIGLEILRQQPASLLSLSLCGVSPCQCSFTLPQWLRNFTYNLMGISHQERIVSRMITHHETTQHVYCEMLKMADRQTLRHILKSISRYDYLDVLKKNREIPMLIMRSEGDERVNSALDPCLEKLKDQRNIDIIRVNSTGHMINMETPEYFNQILHASLVKAKLKDSKPLSIPPERQS
jgi:3-oxoadipate enol-lactonase